MCIRYKICYIIAIINSNDIVKEDFVYSTSVCERLVDTLAYDSNEHEVKNIAIARTADAENRNYALQKITPSSFDALDDNINFNNGLDLALVVVLNKDNSCSATGDKSGCDVRITTINGNMYSASEHKKTHGHFCLQQQ